MTAAWHVDGRGPLTGVDWTNWSCRRDTSLDPYLIWADLTSFAGFSVGNDVPGEPDYRRERWPLIVELSAAGLPVEGKLGDRDPKVPWVFGLMRIPGIYVAPADASTPANLPTRFVTARVDPAELRHLLVSEHIVRFQLGLPRIGDTAFNRQARRAEAKGNEYRTVVGVIDDGCAFAHPVVRTPGGGTRVEYLWDQDDRRKAGPEGWRATGDIGYGAELDPNALDRAARLSSAGNELEPYRAVRYGRVRLDETSGSIDLTHGGRPLHEEMMLSGTHGTAVVALAAGSPSPLRSQQAPNSNPPADSAQLAKDLAAHDVTRLGPEQREQIFAGLDRAGSVDVVFVQLPTRSVMDTSGGSLAVHVLDGLQYIVDRAQRLRYHDEPPDLPGTTPSPRRFVDNRIIVNVSYGALAGSHDGTSMIELALREMVRNDNIAGPARLWVVLAAGNAHRSRTHARLELAPGDCKALTWRIGPDNPHAAFLEIWFPDEDSEGKKIPEQHIDAMSVSVQGPGLPLLANLRVGDVWQFGELPAAQATCSPTPSAAAIFVRKAAQGRRGTMALLAVAPTRPGYAAAIASQAAPPHGDWIVFVGFGQADSPMTTPRIRVHAWAERNDLIYATERPQQSVVVGDDPVPDMTEYLADSMDVIGRGKTIRRNEPLPHPLQPEHSLGSLAGVPAARTDFAELASGETPDDDLGGTSDIGNGAIVVVGAHRLLDGEVADYSAGGPARDLPAGHERVAWFGSDAEDKAIRGPMTRRIGPDADAPGDLSPAVRGLRVPGVRPGAHVRLSGTSAAAPLVARSIANFQVLHWYIDRLPDSDKEKARRSLSALLFDEPARVDPSPDGTQARATMTPRKDDAFRRGRRRVR